METFLIALLKVIETQPEEEEFLQAVLPQGIYDLYLLHCDIILRTEKGQFSIADILRRDPTIDIEDLAPMNKLLTSSYGEALRKHLEEPWDGIQNDYLVSILTPSQYTYVKRFVMVYYYIKLKITRPQIEDIIGISLTIPFFSGVFKKASQDSDCILDELILRVEEQGLWKEEEQ